MTKQRVILVFAVLALSVALIACRSKGAPTATAVPTATVAPATPSPEATVAVGGMDVAWEHVIKPNVPVVARVNGEEISTEAYLADLRAQLYSVTAYYRVDWNDEQAQQNLPGFQDQVVQRLVQLRLMEQLAKAENIVVSTADIEAEIAKSKEQVQASGAYKTWEEFLAAVGMDDEGYQAQTRSYLLYNKLLEAHGGPDTAEHVHAAHIVVGTEEECKEVLARLQQGESFADLAKEYSLDTDTKDNGGDLDWFIRGEMVPEFEEAAFSLQPGETSGVVKTDYGYHIIRVLGREVRKVSDDLLPTLREQNFRTWFEAELAKANVEILVKFGTSAPLTTPTPGS